MIIIHRAPVQSGVQTGINLAPRVAVLEEALRSAFFLRAPAQPAPQPANRLEARVAALEAVQPVVNIEVRVPEFEEIMRSALQPPLPAARETLWEFLCRLFGP